ncbi:MAG: hypothetical protein GXY14_08480 [Spirochaetes bacterium]|nr:hypothetical protein [Spirochaetota bacterium]
MNGNILTAVDACVNRAMEGLRVCEDIFRFALHNPVSSELKNLRHSIRDALSGIPVSSLLGARDIVADSQKFIDTEAEGRRDGLLDVFRANIRRAAEAARSLEELFKTEDPATGAQFQSIRFRIYEIEKRCWFILKRSELAERVKQSRPAIIECGAGGSGSISEACSSAVSGGAGIIILRPGSLCDSDLLCEAGRVEEFCAEHNLLYFIFSRPDIAILTKARGLCLTRRDMSVADARIIAGPEMLIGTAATVNDAARDTIFSAADFIFTEDGSVNIETLNFGSSDYDRID